MRLGITIKKRINNQKLKNNKQLSGHHLVSLSLSLSHARVRASLSICPDVDVTRSGAARLSEEGAADNNPAGRRRRGGGGCACCIMMCCLCFVLLGFAYFVAREVIG